MHHSTADRSAYRDDLLFMRDRYPQLDRSFTAATRAEFVGRIGRLLARVDKLTPAGFAVGIAHAVAASDNAHSMPILFQRLHVVPIRLHWFSDGLYVVRSATGPDSLLGGRILLVQGHTVEYWQSVLADVIGGNHARRRALAPFFLSSPEALAELDAAGDPRRLTVSYEDAAGNQIDCALETKPLTSNTAIFPSRDPTIGIARETEFRWRQLFHDEQSLPLYLRELSRNVLHEWLPPRRGLHLAIRRLADSDDVSLEAYLLDIVEQAARRRIRYAIVDLRFNDGGNYVLAHSFCRALPAILPDDGKLFIVTNNQTFSAGIAVAALLKFHGGTRSMIVGEPIGDRTTFWADGGVFDLPRTGLPVRCAVAFHDWENGCRDPRVCPWFNLLYSVAAGSLQPALPVPTRFADYAGGTDPVLRVVMDETGTTPPC